MCILGSGGFIGSHVSKKFPNAHKVTSSELDLTNPFAVRAFFSRNQFKIIIHCAAVGGSRLCPDKDGTFEQNILMFSNVMRFAKFEHMIWFSSGAADKANTPYGAAKKVVESMAQKDPRVYILKIWGCFGPGEPPQRLLATGIREGHVRIPKDRVFSFIHVDDVTDVIEAIIESGFNLEPKFMNMVYPGPPSKLSDILDMANISYVISSKDMDEDYTGPNNVTMLRPVLKERVQQYVNEGVRLCGTISK
jgi:nucleoside-diphosphate-sugar epimerase